MSETRVGRDKEQAWCAVVGLVCAVATGIVLVAAILYKAIALVKDIFN